MSTSGSPAPRTLADQLRGWDDARLARLLEARPDLASPAPQDSSQLAARAATRSSVLRTLDQLTHLDLVVLDAALSLGGRAEADVLVRRVHAAPAAVAESLARLRDRALLWGADDEIRTLSVLGELLGTQLSNVGQPAAELLTTYDADRLRMLTANLGLPSSGSRHDDAQALGAALAHPDRVHELVAEVDAKARAILEHLEREGKDGSVESASRVRSRADVASGPVDQLLARGLLVARDRRHVTVPREVVVALRAGHTTRAAADDVPALVTGTRDQQLVDRVAAGAAAELVRHVELLLEHWGAAPPGVLRGGGLAVRDLRVVADLLHLDPGAAALHVELAVAAGLAAVGQDADGSEVWLPTDAFDAWTAGEVEHQWHRLAAAWWEQERLTGLVGTRENRGGTAKTINALTPGLERAWLPETRRTVLAEVAVLPPGQVLAADDGTASLLTRLDWLRPRRPAARAQAVTWALAEATAVGVTALGGMSTHGRALLARHGENPERAAAADPAAVLSPLLPDPVDHVLLQADLTAVAPGPLERELARQVALVAEVESRGGATTYRFTESSVRRAFDSGWSAREVHDFLDSASRTPVPQPLSYLVDDVSRRFGTVRVGAAEAFLRSDDETALATLVHDPRASHLRLRRIAPTVLVSDVPVDVLLPALRELGAAPVVEAADGTVRVARREARRSRSPRLRPPSPSSSADPARRAARVTATVTALRAGDRAAEARPAPALHAADPATPATTMAVLRRAVATRQSVWIGYVDNHGGTVERVVDPVRVDAGWLSAYDHRTEDVRSFAVHRINRAQVVAADS